MKLAIIACGGRDFAGAELVHRTLDAIWTQATEMTLIHGGATGADTLAAVWAATRGVRTLQYTPDWERYGRGAGPMRNRRMLDTLLHLREQGCAVKVVAFPSTGPGTTDMVRQARAAGVEVQVVEG